MKLTVQLAAIMACGILTAGVIAATAQEQPAKNTDYLAVHDQGRNCGLTRFGRGCINWIRLI